MVLTVAALRKAFILGCLWPKRENAATLQILSNGIDSSAKHKADKREKLARTQSSSGGGGP